MANVYVSILGTSDYQPCVYHCEEFEVKNVRFVQEATVAHLCRSWTPEDRILILTTDKAHSKNWIDNGHERNGETLAREGLETRLRKLNLQVEPKSIHIPEGFSEEELERIFQMMYDQLGYGDQVFFDITHAFRHISMQALVVLHYAKVLKNIEVKGIYYGAFEAIGEPREVARMAPEERRAPILDLRYFDTLLDWSQGVYSFANAGDASLCSRLAETGVHGVLAETRGKNEEAQVIKGVAKRMTDFTKDLATCRCRNISKSAADLKDLASKCSESTMLPAFKPLVEKIREEVKEFDGDEILDGVRAARWCFTHNLIQQGCTILSETVISQLCRLMGLNPEIQNDRELASAAVTIFAKKIPQEEWNRVSSENPDRTRACLDALDRRRKLVEIHRNLSRLRNDINHGGKNDEAMKAADFEKNVGRHIDAMERLLADDL
jgi:CRISPR-associated Csx2 family protein